MAVREIAPLGRRVLSEKKLCQEKTLDGTQGRTLGQSVRSPLSGVKPPGSGRASASAHFLPAQSVKYRAQHNTPSLDRLTL